MTQAADDTHSIWTESSFFADGWWAVCSCGWAGKRRPTSDDALADGRDHQGAERAAEQES